MKRTLDTSAEIPLAHRNLPSFRKAKCESTAVITAVMLENAEFPIPTDQPSAPQNQTQTAIKHKGKKGNKRIRPARTEAIKTTFRLPNTPSPDPVPPQASPTPRESPSYDALKLYLNEIGRTPLLSF